MSQHAQDPGPYALHPQLAADTHPLATLGLCDLRLMDDANYPWLVLVPRVPGARELLDLDAPRRHLLTDEIDLAGRALREVFRPFKLNVAALGNLVPQLHVHLAGGPPRAAFGPVKLNVAARGNLVPQLHVHLVGRFEDDPAWPAPVWGRVAARPYSPDALVGRIRLLDAALRACTRSRPQHRARTPCCFAWIAARTLRGTRASAP